MKKLFLTLLAILGAVILVLATKYFVEAAEPAITPETFVQWPSECVSPYGHAFVAKNPDCLAEIKAVSYVYRMEVIGQLFIVIPEVQKFCLYSKGVVSFFILKEGKWETDDVSEEIQTALTNYFKQMLGEEVM